MANSIAVIHLYDLTTNQHLTYPSYFATEQIAKQTIDRLATFWATMHGGEYCGWVEEESAFITKKGVETHLRYTVQVLSDYDDEMYVDRII